MEPSHGLLHRGVLCSHCTHVIPLRGVVCSHCSNVILHRLVVLEHRSSAMHHRFDGRLFPWARRIGEEEDVVENAREFAAL